MDGNFSNKFVFDLQRFAEQSISYWVLDTNGWTQKTQKTFAEFKADAENSSYSTIQLDSNLTLEEDISSTKIQVFGNCTIDLNGKALTLSNFFMVGQGGNLTLTDKSAAGTGTLTSNTYSGIENYGTLTVKLLMASTITAARSK